MSVAPSWCAVAAALARRGLRALGGFHPSAEDHAPPLPGGGDAGTLILAGNAGPGLWAAFGRRRPEGTDPLDRWSRETLAALATRFGAGLVMPSDGPPYAPFQRWALRTGRFHASPLGILIHPEFGLWTGFRGALLLRQRLVLPRRRARPRPCDTCREKPCLSACPVDAFAPGLYRVDDCAAHLRDAAGADCLGRGCRARRACPVGRAARHAPEQAQFHMRAFLDGRPATGPAPDAGESRRPAWPEPIARAPTARG